MKKLTQEQAHAKWVAVHGDTYDYTDTMYLGSDKYIYVRCKKHDRVFPVTHSNHCAGKGCPICNGGSQMDTETFIIKARERHGDRYDYSLINYVRNDIDVDVICKEHGAFPVLPSNHLHGQNCSKCSRPYSNKEEFAEEGLRKYGSVYSYGKVKYVDSKTNIIITCSKHGDFKRTPAKFIHGSICSGCRAESRVSHISKEEAIKRAIECHGNFYDYSLVDFKFVSDEVNIICPKHGVFKQEMDRHYGNRGCESCGRERIAISQKSNRDEFATKAKIVHGSTYEYSNVVYEKADKLVYITCKEHGDFPQTPNNHLNGSGCKFCATSGFKSNLNAWFYVVAFGDFVGFGITNDLNTRLKTHKRNLKKHGYVMVVKETFFGYGEDILSLERKVKKNFDDHITDSGVIGFVTEAMLECKEPDLLDFAKENRPEGRSDKT